MVNSDSILESPGGIETEGWKISILGILIFLQTAIQNSWNMVGWFYSMSNFVSLFNTGVRLVLLESDLIICFEVTNDNNLLQIIVTSSNYS